MKLKHCFFAAAIAISVFCSGSALAALTGQYLFENNTDDTSGNNRHGTAVGGPTFTTGLYPGSTNAILQTAAGQSTQLPSAADFIRNAPGATLTAWIRADALPVDAQANIVAVNNGAAGGIGAARALIEYSGVSTGPAFRVVGRQADSGGSTIITGNPTGGAVVVGQTYFIAGVFDYVNGDMFLYIDGQLISSNTNIPSWTANSIDTANNLARIGASADGTTNSWIGAIDGVRIFDNAYGPDEILALYQNPDVIPSTNEPLPGDTNGDGEVLADDLDPIRMNWRMTGKTRIEGNLSGDTAGLVDFVDFRQWKTAFLGGEGSLDGIDLSFTAVPEPSAFFLAVMSAAAFGRRCSRRRAV